MEKPSFIEQELWDRVALARDWDLEENKHIAKTHFSIHYKVCALISDFKVFNNRPRYVILEMLDRTTATLALADYYDDKPISPLPDLIDLQTHKLFDVKVCKKVDQDKYEEKNLEVDPSVQILLFGIDGSYHPTVEQYLDPGQIQDVQSFLTSVYSELTSKFLIEDYYRALAEAPPATIKINQAFRELCMQSTDLPFVPPTQADHLPPLPTPVPWTEIKTLPRFVLPKEKEACWNHFLIGSEAVFITGEDTTDQEILINLFDQGFGIKLDRTVPSFEQRDVECITISIASAIQGQFRRAIEYCDARPFGIGRKKYHQEPSDPEYERADFPIQERGFPTWMATEMNELVRISSWKWIDLDSNPIRTTVDEMATRIGDEFLEIVQQMDVCAHIEKLVVTTTKMDNHAHADRNSVICIPITTRKPMASPSGELAMSEFWGIVILGPHHPKRDTDKIPFVTMELCREDNPTKYEKYSHGILNTRTRDGEEREMHVLIRINSISRIKLFYYTNARKVLLQPCNIYSKCVLKQASLQNALPERFYKTGTVDIYHGTKAARITIETWIKRLLVVGYLNAIFNDSQMEGFLANIRRLHMARHALTTDRRVFTPPGGLPGSKVQETILNNPMVLFLAETWNSLPAYH